MARTQDPILLVEDNDLLRKALATFLEAEGYAVATAVDGADALARLSRGLKPCVILLDVSQSRGEGFRFREEQLRRPRFARIPTVAYSADLALRPRALALGMRFFRQPDRLSAMLEEVARRCRRTVVSNPEAGSG